MSESLKTPDKLFYVRDDNSILNGTSTFSDDIILYKTNPTTLIPNKIYIDTDTLEGKVYTGYNYEQVIYPVIVDRSDIMDSCDIASIKFNTQYNHFVITKIDGTEDTIEISDMVLDIHYSNGIFTIVNERSHLSYGRQVVLSDFIDGITYDGNGNLSILFKDSDSTLLVVTDGLLDKDGDINFTITGNHFIAECLLYANNANEMAYVNYIYTIYRCNTGVSSTITKNVISSMTKYMSTIVNSSYNIMTTVGLGKSGEIILADEEGNAKASGVIITDKIYELPSDTVVPTEKAIVDFITDNLLVKSDITTYEEFKKLEPGEGTDRKLASEKTLLEQLSWDII
jgi:hypothetical protein